MRTLGPIGHLSAEVRKLLEIDEEEALLGKVRKKRKPTKDDEKTRKASGGRFTQEPDFSFPGPFSDRPVSANGRVSLHFSRDVVTKGANGSSILHLAAGPKRLTPSAPADHDNYVSRPEAVMTISAANFEDYAGREAALELAGDGKVALFTNISPEPAVRSDYWRKVHEHERTPKPDAVEFYGAHLPASSWRQIAAIEDLPAKIRELAAKMATTKGNKSHKKKPDAELVMGRAEAGKLLAVIRKEVGAWDRKKSPIRIRQGRGGRTQFRYTAEFPQGIDTTARLRITAEFCQELDAKGVMYTAAIHAPDAHNDERNFHLHVATHDRPARRLEDGRWDFEVREVVPGQWNRFRYPYRQPKIAALSRDPAGGNPREYAASEIYRMREKFADLCNTELKLAGCGRLFDPRTYEKMGIDQPPTERLGPQSSALETAGIPTAKGSRNAEILWTAELQRNLKMCNKAQKTREKLRAHVENALKALDGVICPLLSGPKLMIFWITKEIMNAEQEASPGRDYWQAA
ncbi:MobA/MobL family protein [Sphingopyxis witflariensis]|uniref:MobA/MobL protein domain-containing protein n=1 Tax=Sphingopyxis witflariensis TaxID=173675 RepID=A0A246JZB3_9SPHN|nr:MobA/MobL family protein [Sphingopyxis witflariensis]OWQ98363.1 hypothetical protein CDQ91_07670 [Sphingopyxis witflariensis]